MLPVDPRQFSAVGRGGMFAHLVESHGAVDLDQVHRFRHHWERQASLRLRTGDPQALVEYDRQGRLHGGTQAVMESELIDGWKKARGQSQSVALMANTTDTVARLNQLAQQSRIMNGELDIDKPWLKAGGSLIFVGDEVVTRRNDRRLRTDQELMVKNRDHWTITDIHRDRSITVTGSRDALCLAWHRLLRPPRFSPPKPTCQPTRWTSCSPNTFTRRGHLGTATSFPRRRR
jgi:ATP-dependent exoDNAse (exonuclease V) alpha subunit